MLKSRTIFIIAAIAIFGIIAKVAVSLIPSEVYTIHPRWGTTLVVDAISCYVIAKSEVKHKVLLFILGGFIYTTTGVILALLSAIGLVYIPM